MPISISFIRRSSSLIAPRAPDFPLKRFLFFSKYSSIPAQDFLTHLQKHQSHVEKNLDAVKSNLDSQCISQVLEHCAIEKPKLGVRFFVWAAFHPSHRHTSYMYSKACKLLNLEKNPRIIADVVDEYRAEGFAVSVKMFKVLLNLCREARCAEMGLWVLRKMKELRCMPDTVSYNVVIRLLVANGRLDESMGLLKEMPLCDLTPDMVTYGSVIKGLCDAGDLEGALGLVKVMKGHGCVPNSVIYSTILDGICMHGSLKLGLEFLDGMEKVEEKEKDEGRPNVVTYTTIIKGFIDKGMASEARSILDRMYDSELKPNRVTFVTLIDGLIKEGKVEEALKVVDTFGGDGVRTDELYNMLVLSLFRAGKHKESEEMFRTMLARGLKPSGLTASSIIRGIVLEGRVLDGYFLFQEIEKLGSFVSIDPDVYSSLLACLCQENHLAEAGSLVNIMVERRVHLEPSQYEHLANFRSFLN
ncbi:pentatricopeptide repeat-containing protein-like protein [Salvia divinorum]|uniref:Pentatricopeptide repeat-containing protein-like protein n=1 Tax=Salvia divinorum TaxID=28513 RepID=A0ABD1H953_SALDI